MKFENLTHEALQVLDDVISAQAIIESQLNNGEKRKYLGDMLGLIRKHPHYDKSVRVYKVEIIESYSKILEIEASTEAEAVAKVRDQYYDNSGIDDPLDLETDYVDTNFKIYED